MDAQEAEKLAEELVQLSIEQKEISSRIRQIKAELKDYADLENMNEHTWSNDNGYVEVITKTKYKLTDVPADFTIPSDVAAIDVAQKAFKSKVELSKEGKKMFKEQYPPIVRLMIPSIKKELRVVI